MPLLQTACISSPSRTRGSGLLLASLRRMRVGFSPSIFTPEWLAALFLTLRGSQHDTVFAPRSGDDLLPVL